MLSNETIFSENLKIKYKSYLDFWNKPENKKRIVSGAIVSFEEYLRMINVLREHKRRFNL